MYAFRVVTIDLVGIVSQPGGLDDRRLVNGIFSSVCQRPGSAWRRTYTCRYLFSSVNDVEIGSSSV
jgi:hypothetical protein